MRGSSLPMNIAAKNPIVAPSAARRQHLADQRVGKAGMLLQQRRQQHHRRDVQHAEDADQHEAERVVAVEQQPQVQERPLRRSGCARRRCRRRERRRSSRARSPATSNQSSRWPRDSTSCTQEIAADRLRKPIQSSRTRLPRRVGQHAQPQPDAGDEPDRHQPVERPAPAVHVGRGSRRAPGRSPARSRPSCRRSR